MVTRLRTLAANLKHGAYNQQNANIGGGIFAPGEQLELAHAIERREQLLQQCLDHIDGIDPDWRPLKLIEALRKELT